MTNAERKRRAAKRRRILVASGRWVPPLVDPTRARRHIHGLEAYGLSPAAIGHLAGLHSRQIERVARPQDGQAPDRITRATEASVLDARFDLDRLLPKHHVAAAGTQRRLRALARIGYSLSDLAPLLEVTFSQVGQYANPAGGRVHAQTARKVRDLYVRLSMTLGPTPKASQTAARAGWPPPWAWDDETIDHPDTVPDLECLGAPGGPRPSEDTLEDVQWILTQVDSTATIDQVAARLNVTKDAITRALKRVEESRTKTYRERVLGAVEGPLTWDQSLELAQDLVEVWAVRERFYANTEASGRQVTVRSVAS